MQTYDTMRQFADSWGLLGMFVFFVLVLLMVLRPGARESAREAAMIPFNSDGSATENCCGDCDGSGPCARVARFVVE